jgi:hypothetical protein
MSRLRNVTVRRREIAEHTARLAALDRRFKEAVEQRSDDYASSRDAFFNLYDQLAFPGGLTKRLHELSQQNPEAVEDAICFLEVDPNYFRSGYIKERILHRLKHCRISAGQRTRLMQCILRSIEGGSRRVFAAYARAAGAHPTSTLLAAVESRLDSPDPEVRRRASQVLAVTRSRMAASNTSRPGAAPHPGSM